MIKERNSRTKEKNIATKEHCTMKSKTRLDVYETRSGSYSVSPQTHLKLMMLLRNTDYFSPVVFIIN